jgi:hypothetical protein
MRRIAAATVLAALIASSITAALAQAPEGRRLAIPSAAALLRFYPSQLSSSPTGAVEDSDVWLAKVQGLLAAAPALLQQSLLMSQTKQDFEANIVLLEQLQQATLKRGTTMQASAKGANVATRALGDASNLVYKPLPPCRIMDSRNATAGSGVQGPLVGNVLYSIPGFLSPGGTYQQYGGEFNFGPATDCGLTNPPGSSIKALAIVITILAPNFDAFLGVSDINDLSEVLTNVALNYTHGQGLSTMFLVPQDTANTIYFAMPAQLVAHLIFDVVGYFVTSDATALDCTTVTASGSIAIGTGTDTTIAFSACASGYTRTGAYCNGGGNTGTSGIYLIETGPTGCTYRNLGGSPVTGNAVSVCCRVPGR